MRPDEPSHDHLVDETERWFERRGLPYTGTKNVSPYVLANRVIPLMANEYALTKETVLMSGFLGVVAAMQFAISIMTDSEFSTEHINGFKEDAREVLAVRARFSRYLANRDRPPDVFVNS